MSDSQKHIRRVRFAITCGFKAAVTVVVMLAVTAASRWLSSAPIGIFSWHTVAAATFYFFSLLIAAVWVFFLCSFWLRKAFVNMICFAALFIWGSVSYFMWPVDYSESRDETIMERQFEAPNRTMAAFFPSRGGFEDLGQRARCHYYAFHSLVVFFVAAMMFSIFGRGLVNRLRRRLVPGRLLNVFWGDTEAGFLLARNIMQTTYDKQTAVMLPEDLCGDRDALKRITHRLDDQDIIWERVDEELFGRTYLRGRNHYFLSDSGHDNVVSANRLVKKLRTLGSSKPEDHVFYIRVEQDEDERQFLAWAERAKEVVTPIIFREADVVAREFIRRYPMIDCAGVSVDFASAHVTGVIRVLLIGFGATGQAVLREMVCSGQFEGASQFSVDVIESDQAVVEAYCRQHTEAISCYGINFRKDVDRAEGTGFEQFLYDNMAQYNRIVVCLPGDVMTIRVASEIAGHVHAGGVGPRPGVLFARVTDPSRCDYTLEDGRFILFGNMTDIYNLHAVDTDSVDQMAQVLNAEWAGVESKKDVRTAWRQATFEGQQSSRASAVGAWNLARLLGCEIVSLDDPRPSITRSEFEATLSVGRELVLARNEHLRWNAYHRMLGYLCWDMNTPRLESMPPDQMKANQCATFGRHAALVSFDELPAVDYRIACALNPANRSRLKQSDFVGATDIDILGSGKCQASLQAYDIRFVRKIYGNVFAAGLKLVRKA